jgi:hypothetical protein
VKILLSSLLVALCFCGCAGKDIRKPGESLGFYAVSGALKANTCGDVPSPWDFRIELRKEAAAARLYWAQGDLPISAALSLSREATFNAESSLVVRAATAKRAGCTLTRKDTVQVKLSEDETQFTGSLRYDFYAEPGSACDNVSSAGISGVPCGTQYDLQATVSK